MAATDKKHNIDGEPSSLPLPRKTRVKGQNALPATKRTRISPILRAAINHMVWNSLTRDQAAQVAGMTDHGLRQALRKPHVKKLLNSEYQALRDSLGPRALARSAQLMDTANSENVRQRAAEWVGGIAGEVPVSRHEIAHSGTVTHVGYAYPPAKPDTDQGVIDHDAEDADTTT